jgi:hypothetical protein
MANQGASNEDRPSLEQAQYEYRKTIYFAGLKLLETYSEAVIGRDPSVSREAIPLESGGGAPTEALAHGQPSPPIAWGPPSGWHIYSFGPWPPPPPPPPVTDGPPSGWHIYSFGTSPPPPPPPPVLNGPPSGWHIYSFGTSPPPSPPPPVLNGPPSGWHIYAVTKLVEVVLSLKCPPKPPK